MLLEWDCLPVPPPVGQTLSCVQKGAFVFCQTPRRPNSLIRIAPEFSFFLRAIARQVSPRVLRDALSLILLCFPAGHSC